MKSENKKQTEQTAEEKARAFEYRSRGGKKGGAVKNPRKGFGSHSNRMKAIAGLTAGLTPEERAAVLAKMQTGSVRLVCLFAGWLLLAAVGSVAGLIFLAMT